MSEPNLSSAIALIRAFAIRECATNVHDNEVVQFLQPILFEPRDLLRAVQAKIVTPSETAGALAGRIYRWLDQRGATVPSGDAAAWSALAKDLEAALFPLDV